ncbi:hypothetical protein [Nonomuraea harbinensis]|uniref:Uncharacterized protein n=1 Tax=Nonomuraea harbinensis TaxID=1286938 RepID=A0ABW1BQ34_9ACTN|nr:hypothetical protein [Nonomuraea harbinensis]
MCSFQRAARLPRRELYARAQHGDTPGARKLLGVEIADREHFQAVAGAAGGVDFVFGGEEEMAQGAQAWESLSAYAATLAEARRR